MNGLAGTVIPFWDWFDKSENKACILNFLRERHFIDDMFSVEMAHHFLPLLDPFDHVWSSLTTRLAAFCPRHR